MYIRLFCLWLFPTVAVMEDSGLKLVHVIFKHAREVPFKITTDPWDLNPKVADLAEVIYPQGLWSMTNEEKRNMYDLGVHLRKTYDVFLGDDYTPEVMTMRTTEYPNSMTSAQLVNAGLWPPSEILQWNKDLMWQPIPTEYDPYDMDTLLLGQLCPTFVVEKQRVMDREEVQALVDQHQKLFEYIRNHSGLEMTEPSDVSLLYNSLEARANLNLTLPGWADDIFPYGEMLNATLLEYDLCSWTSVQRNLLGGPMIKEVISNSLAHVNGSLSSKRKIKLYSGHEDGIVGILHNLGLWYPHVPGTGATLIFELHYDNATDIYGIKIIYYTGVDDITIPLKLPYCAEICPLKDFANLMQDNIPDDEGALCGRLTATFFDNDFTETFENSASVNAVANNIFWLALVLFFWNRIL